eukprot:8857209-Prorocentrum_lima.AAC.1
MVNSQKLPLTHRSLWQKLSYVMERRPGDIQVQKVKSHCSSGELEAGLIQPQEYLANSFADCLASEAARVKGVSLAVLEQ